MNRLFATYAVILAGLVATAQLQGWCFADYSKIPNVPPTVRNNPGSYRSHYSYHYTRIGGK
jgi:hypothetical protein